MPNSNRPEFSGHFKIMFPKYANFDPPGVQNMYFLPLDIMSSDEAKNSAIIIVHRDLRGGLKPPPRC